MQKLVVAAVVVAVGTIGWLYWRQSRDTPLVVSGFVEADQIRVGSRVGGRVAKVLVAEGGAIGVGDPIFEIDPFDLTEQLAEATARLAASKSEYDRLAAGYRCEEIEQARAKRDAARAMLDKLEAGPRPQEVEIARQTLNRAKAELELAESEHARIVRLKEADQAAPNEFDKSQRTLKSARATVAAAEQDLAMLEQGSRVEDVAEARAKLAEAQSVLALFEAGFRAEDVARAAADVAASEARVAAVRAQVDELTVRSPCDCEVEAIDLQPGDLVAASAPAVSLLDTSSLWVRAYVPESRLRDLRLGQRIPIKLDSLAGDRAYGKLTFISQQAEFAPRNIQTPEERSKQVFRIKVTLAADSRNRVRVGMGADVLLDEADDE